MLTILIIGWIWAICNGINMILVGLDKNYQEKDNYEDVECI